MADIWVRTKDGEFRDDRHHFTTKWQKVSESEISSVHLDNPKLEFKSDKVPPKAEDET